MALYWVWGTWNWSDATNHWATTSGGAPWAGNLPTATDDVFFDSASNATAYTVTIDATTKLCRDITFAAPASGNVTWAWSVGMTVSWSMTLYSWLIASYTWWITFNATSTGKTITMAGVTSLAPWTAWSFNGVWWWWTFQDTFTLWWNQQHTLLAWTLDMNWQTVNISAFRSNWSWTRTLTMWSATITLSTTNQVAFEFTWSWYTVTANTASITTTTTSTAPFNWWWKTYYNVTVDKSASTTNTEFQNATWDTFNNLTIKSGNAKTVTCKFYWNNTINWTLTINWNSSINRILVQSDTKWTARTLTAATVTITNADFQDITGAGAGSWNLSAITGLSWDCGGNSWITFTTPVTTNWTSGATWSTATWSSRVPLPQDTATFTTAWVATITQDMPRIWSVDFSTSSNKTWTTSTACSVFWSINLTNLATLTSDTQTYTFEGRWSNTLNSGWFTWAKSITLNAPSWTLTLSSNISSWTSRTLDITSWTFNSSSFNVSFWFVSSSSSTTTRTINLWSGTWSITGSSSTIFNINSTATITAWTSIIKITDTWSSAITFAWWWKTYNNVWFSRWASTASNTISWSNTFADFKDDWSVAHSILFTAGTTQTVTTFTVNGTAWQEITLNSTTTATHALVKSWGWTITCNYLNIQHSVATPWSTWTANNSTNNQSVATAGSGWSFWWVANTWSWFFMCF